ncbi:MAG TPA: flagellar biosynthesis anti-sigma factor FlgM [Herbaspirillum sp.]|nr:flagellar biosynthesis anti-sigma factor FlgM [Herbaspirillum sp.]
MNVNDALKIKNGTNLPKITRLQARTSTANSARTDNTNINSANVQLSVQCQSLGANVLHTDASFDAKKIAEIKAAIANGTFQIDPEKIASGLLATVKNLINTRRKT